MRRLRLFFALWPPDEVRNALFAAAAPLRAACRGKPVAKRNLHLTVAFLGGVAEERLVELKTAAAAVRAPRFELRFDGHGWFERPRVVWLGCRQVPATARTLVARLNAVLETLGFRPDPRPFHPHLTVLRNCRACDFDGVIEPVAWPVSSLTLVRSETHPTGSRYEPLAHWPLDDA